MSLEHFSHLTEAGLSVLENNRSTVRHNDTVFSVTSPSSMKEKSPYGGTTYLWDTGFIAIALAHSDPPQAKNEVQALLSRQRDDGFLPCEIIWRKMSLPEKIFYGSYVRDGVTMITQPPVIPRAVLEIYETTKDAQFVESVYPQLTSFMDWWHTHRDRRGDGLVQHTNPWEWGIDQSPTSDKQLGITSLQPGVLEAFSAIFKVNFQSSKLGWDEEEIFVSGAYKMSSVLMNSIYAQGWDAMRQLATTLGKREDAREFGARYQQTRDALIAQCWSSEQEIFFDLDQQGRQVPIKTVASLMPLILPDLPKPMVESLVQRHLLNDREFWTAYPVPSVAADEPTHNPKNSRVLWRGPTWVNTNWFLTEALLSHGYTSLAEELTRRTATMIEKSGFVEHYGPHDGAPYGEPSFGWSTLIIPMLEHFV